jgi:hypothetical protein
VLSAPAYACTLLEPSSAAEAARWRKQTIDWQADRLAASFAGTGLRFYGEVTAVRRTDMSEGLGGPVRLGWQEVPAWRVWVSPKSAKDQLPSVFSIHVGEHGDTCGYWSAFHEGDVVLVLAERRYKGDHWFGDIVGPADIRELLPALAKRGMKLDEPPR